MSYSFAIDIATEPDSAGLLYTEMRIIITTVLREQHNRHRILFQRIPHRRGQVSSWCEVDEHFGAKVRVS